MQIKKGFKTKNNSDEIYESVNNFFRWPVGNRFQENGDKNGIFFRIVGECVRSERG